MISFHYRGLVHLAIGEFRDAVEPVSCAGKFNKENLIVLTDGSNCSGGYYIVKPFKENDVATVVTMGGYVDEYIRWVFADRELRLACIRGLYLRT